MYWWNTGALAENLKAKRVSQREKMKYLLADTIMWSAMVECSFLWDEPASLITAVSALVGIVVPIWGVLIGYQANRHGDDQEFIDRFICLSWPVGIRLAVLFVALYSTYMLGGFVIAGDRFDAFMQRTTIVDVMATAVFEVVYYWRIRLHLLAIAGVGVRPITL